MTVPRPDPFGRFLSHPGEAGLFTDFDGTLSAIVDDPDEKAAILARQLGHFEPADSARVTPSTANESDRRQLPGIRGVRLQIEAVRAKMKYGGNKSVEHRHEIAAHLAERAGPMDAEARARLLRRMQD